MFKTSHLQELKRRYASIYAPPVEEKVIEDGTIEGANQYRKDTPGQEEVEVAESFELQATMALDDVGIKSNWKKGKLYVAKRDIKKAEKALGKSFKKMKKGAEPDLYYEEVELDEKDPSKKIWPPTVETLRAIVDGKSAGTVKFKDGKALVDTFSASAMIQVYDALKRPELKKTFEKMLQTTAGYKKSMAFAFSLTK